MSDDQTFTAADVQRISEEAAATAAKAAVENFQAQQAYGQPNAGGGGSQARPAQTTGPEAAWDRVIARLQRGDGGQDAQFKRDFNEGIGARIRDAAYAAVNAPSYKSFSRPGTPEDKKLRDERRRQRGGSL